jgi:membrane fusion protein, multidrug efflux system
VPVVAVEEPRLEVVPGTVRATDETLIGSRIMANVIRVGVRAGARVEEGDLLVELDGQALEDVLAQRRQEAAAASAALEDSRLARERADKLIASRSISQAEYDRAQTADRMAAANLERARQAVAEAETSLGYTRIRAPMGGTIVERFIEPGDTATPGRTLLKLFNPGRLRVEATLRESLIRRVGTGDTLTARIDAVRTSVAATVEEIVPAADPGSRTFTLKALLPPVDGLFPGMFARLEIPLDPVTRVRIPMAAVTEAGQLAYVTVRGDARDERRLVRLGQRSEGGQVAVESGLSAGETLVIPEL